MKVRFFLRIFLGVLTLNLYANGQVENVSEMLPPSSTDPVGGEVTAQDAGDDQEEIKDRDPFWPVGYVPPAPSERVGTQADGPSGEVDETRGHVDFSGLTKEEQAVIKSKMEVGGILKQGETYLAIINQQLVEEGEELSLSAAGKTYRFGVKKLTTDTILLESRQE